LTTSILSLSEAKTALRYPNPTQQSSDDAALQWFIDAAASVARYHCGDIDLASYTENHDGGNSAIFLRHLPVVEVNSVQENAGFITYDLDYQDVHAVTVGTAGSEGGTSATSIWAFSVDSYENGMITARSVGNATRSFAPGVRNVRVIYQAGEPIVPPEVKLGVVQLVMHWWQNSMLRSMGVSNQFAAFDATMGAAFSREPDVTTIDFGVPFRIVQLFRTHSRMPIIA
jgi:hypothetical protein